MSGAIRYWKRWCVADDARLRARVFATAGLVVAFFVLLTCKAQPPARKAAAETNVASSPTLLLPSGIAYDAAGNLFFVDTRRHQVFEVSLAGALTNFAGTGEQGFGGDGLSAAFAQFNAPTALALGPDGTLYIADTGNQRVRAIDGGGIRTIAGTGARGLASEGSSALEAALRDPGELAVDADGSLLICDVGNHRVVRIRNGSVSTVAGNGVQGFSGDGAAAATAQLDTPSGIAVMGDGRIVIADSHNHRLRVIGKDGVIQTLAGTGVRGYAGDSGSAAAAKLFMPRGLSVTAAGDLLFADSNNHRVRSINAAGIITTIAGDGVQGTGTDADLLGETSLDTPRSIATGPYGVGTFADAPNRSVREIAVDGRLYIVAAPLASRASTVALQMPRTSTYGDASAAIAVTSNAAAPQGVVSVLESGVTLGKASLSAGAGTVPLQTLAAGTHTFSVRYSGDGLNPSAASSPATVNIAMRQVVATADAATMIYGSSVPQLTGAVTGILPQDTALVSASFTSVAGTLSPVGIYPIAAKLLGTGSSNYAVTVAPNSGSLKIVQAGSTVTMQAPTQTYAGLPLTLSASVGSTTSGLPTGEVDFLEGGAVVAKGFSANGVAIGSYLAPAAGAHQLAASYQGDGNFTGSVSAPFAVTVAAMPDFTVSANAAGATVQAGLIATYGLTIASSGGPFTGSVTFSVSGLPAGAKASFSPATVVPGANGASVTLSIETPAKLAGVHWRNDGFPGACLALAPLLLAVWGWRRKTPARLLAVAVIAAILLACSGCGARTVGSASVVNRSFSPEVTATSTNLAGGVVTHSVPLTLNIQ